jgi:hypothetical protein
MGKYIIGESWGECLAFFGIVVMAKYGNSFSFHPIRLISIFGCRPCKGNIPRICLKKP